ncbi:MAG: 4-(cytidine 5'-diphospho)-2-C-methyl-D-erythritol kinase [Eubacteriales bacterium]
MSIKLTIDTRAKINLTLDIINKRKDGYHNVSMVMQTINLFDTLVFEPTGGGMHLTCNHRSIPTNSDNIILQAAFKLKEKYGVKQGASVQLVKRIPIEAGLAGGSSNAAGTLMVLNELWRLHLGRDELLKIASSLGADVPFCMMEGTALAQGIGEKLMPIKGFPLFYVVLVKPDIGISTPWAYCQVDTDKISTHPDNSKMISVIANQDKEGIANTLGNVFEEFIFPHHPELKIIKNKFKELGAIGQLMSGSGPTIYGLFYDEDKAMEAKNVFDHMYNEVFIAQTYNKDKEENHGV